MLEMMTNDGLEKLFSNVVVTLCILLTILPTSATEKDKFYSPVCEKCAR